MTTWHKGPPPSLGWWPASIERNANHLRWWDGRQWSWRASMIDGPLVAAWLAARPESKHLQPNIEWTERPDWWPERSRT